MGQRWHDCAASSDGLYCLCWPKPFRFVKASSAVPREETMRILLVRHGVRAPKQLDPLDQLTDVGRDQVFDLGRALVLRDLRPPVYLTSTHLHAKESADILASHTGGDVKDAQALTSPSRRFNRIFEDVFDEAKNRLGIELEKQDVVA